MLLAVPSGARRGLTDAEKAVTVAGVQQIFLKPDTDDEIKTWAEKIKGTVQPTIYRDADESGDDGGPEEGTAPGRRRRRRT